MEKNKVIKTLLKTYIKFKGCECEMEVPPNGLSSGVRCIHNNQQIRGAVYSK